MVPRLKPAAARLWSDELRVSEITEPEELEAFEPTWRALFGASHVAGPFQSPEWQCAWRRHFCSQGLWTLAIRRAGRVVGILPLFIHVRPDGRRQVTLLGNGISDRLDLLALPHAATAAAQAVLDHLAARAALWDECDFRDLPADSPLLSARLPMHAAEEVSAEEPCPVVRLPDRAEAVYDLVSRKRRADLARCMRRAADSGEVTYHTASVEECGQALVEFMRLHAARWQNRSEAAAPSDDTVQRFHLDAAPALMRRGLLRLHFLRLNGRAIAAQYGFQHAGRGYSYLTAFDPEFARLSPGLLVTGFALRQAVREGARKFDFLRGREPYKYLWGAVDRPQFRRRIAR